MLFWLSDRMPASAPRRSTVRPFGLPMSGLRTILSISARVISAASVRRAGNDVVFDELQKSDYPCLLARSAPRQHRAFGISDSSAMASPEEKAMFDELD